MSTHAGHSADVIVIGGGIVGCAAAHFLSKQGHRVVLVEKDDVAAHASGFAFGVLLPRLFDDPRDPLDALVRRSLELHDEIAGELSDDAPLQRKKAAVLLALNESEASQYRNLYRSDVAIGDVRWLEHGELSHVDARISPGVFGGLYLGDAAEISPHDFTSAMWRSAESNGARLVKGEVRSIDLNADSASIDVDGEIYSAARVIVAAGPWSSRLLESVGTQVPVEPLKGQIVRMKAPGPPMRVTLWWGSDYVGSKSDGLLWCGTTEERAGFDEEPTESAQHSILTSAKRVLPYLEQAEVAQQTACLRPVTADGLPVIGPIQDDSPVIVATGGGRNGIVLGPALGKVAADLATGSAPGVDVDRLSPARFAV